MSAAAIRFEFASRYRSVTHLRAVTTDGTYRVAVRTDGMTRRGEDHIGSTDIATQTEHEWPTDAIWRHNRCDARVPDEVVAAYNAMTAADEAPFLDDYRPSRPVVAASWDEAQGWRRHPCGTRSLANA